MSESSLSASIPAPAGGRLIGFPDLTIETTAVPYTGYFPVGAGCSVVRSVAMAHVTDSEVKVDLDVDTYNYLRRAGVFCPRILVVLVMPVVDSQSVETTEKGGLPNLSKLSAMMPARTSTAASAISSWTHSV